MPVKMLATIPHKWKKTEYPPTSEDAGYLVDGAGLICRDRLCNSFTKDK